MLTRQTPSPVHTSARDHARADSRSAPTRLIAASQIAALLLGLAAAPSFAAPPAAANQTQYVPGHLLIQQRAGLSEAEVDKALKAHGGKRIGKIDRINLHLVQLPAQANTEAIAAALARNKHFKFVELDRIFAPAGTTNDPSLASQWHLAKIGAPTAWEVSAGGDIVIAILDTGVDGSHPDLVTQMVPGWNVYDNNANTVDVQGHGTAVAGTAAAAGNNAIGVASVAWQSRIMPIRISDTAGYATGYSIANGLTWAADHGAHVANISFAGVPGNSTVDSAAQYFKGKGGVTIVAAGNDGSNQSIAPTGNMVIVSATDSNDLITAWSNYGNHINIAAPGQNLLTTMRGGGYGQWWGTSFSSPVVAGTVALMMAANPALSTNQVQSLLYSTALDLGATGKDIYFGAGRVDAARAAQGAATATGNDMQAPTVAISAPTGGSISGLVAVDVAASDNVGVARVELVVNGSTYATDTTSPYAFSWDTTAISSGTATVKAYAYDAAGNYAASQAVSFTVSNTPTPTPVADTIPPTVAFASPANGDRIATVVKINGTASDNLGAAGITQTLAIDGKIVTTVTGSTLSNNWNIKKVAMGNHVLTLTARDAAGNGSSTSITVIK